MVKIKSTFSNAIYMIKTIWRFSKTLFLGKLLISILNGIISPLNAYLLKILIERIVSINWKASLTTIGIIAAINLTNEILLAYISKRMGILKDLFKNYLTLEFSSKVVNMDYQILYSPEMLQKKDMAYKTISEQRGIKYIDILFSCISHTITLISIIYLLSSFSWWAYIVLLFLSAMKIYTVITDKKQSYDTSVALAPVRTEITYYYSMLNDESYVSDMRMFSISKWVISKYKKCVTRTHALVERLLFVVFKNSVMRSFLSTLETVFLYAFVASQMIFYGMSFADFTLATSVLKTFSNSITNITGNLIDIGENSAYVKIYIDFMNTNNTIAVPNKGEKTENLSESKYLFEFSNVSFKYPGSEEFIFENLNLKIKGGKFYVIVGKNGVGKTTLVRLLCRLYDTSSGIIKYMDNDVKDLEYRSYRENIGVVFQDYKYYCMSIAENVAMNEYDESEETSKRILTALNVAGLGERIASLPKGVNTQLGKIFDNEGILLSGGELQKLALARVLFMNPPVVILDEPSSALDALAENELIRTFNSALKGKTVFYISHRLSVAKYADKVIFLEDNNIKGFDTHDNLLKNVESYKNMYESQAKHYK